MNRIEIPINSYVGEIEIREDQTLYENIMRLACENIFEQILDDYPILKEYIELDTEWKAGNTDQSLEDNKWIYFRFKKNNGSGYAMRCACCPSATTTITTSESDTNNGFQSGNMATLKTMFYYNDTYFYSSVLSASMNNCFRHRIKNENDKKIYCLHYYNCAFVFEYGEDYLGISTTPLSANIEANGRIIFAKNNENMYFISVNNASAPTSYASNNISCLDLQEVNTTQKYVREGKMYGFKENNIDISKVYLCTNPSNSTDSKIFANLSDKFISVTSDNLGINSHKSRNIIIVNNKVYEQLFCDIFYDITDEYED